MKSFDRADRNIYTRLDLANPKRNWNKTPGYTEAETTWFAQFLSPSDPVLDVDPSTDGSSTVAVPRNPFVDVWRARHPNTRHYSYFSYRQVLAQTRCARLVTIRSLVSMRERKILDGAWICVRMSVLTIELC
jgi:exonuclease III